MDKNTVETELLPCPFCGSSNVKLGFIRDGKVVRCKNQNCLAEGVPAYHGMYKDAAERAIAAWNKRVPSTPPHITEDELGELERLATMASRGPWKTYPGQSKPHGCPTIYADSGNIATLSRGRTGNTYVEPMAREVSVANAEYIVAACNALPKLIATIRSMKGGR